MGFNKVFGIGLLGAATLLNLACSPVVAQAPSRPVLYYAYISSVGYVPVYAAAPVTRTSAVSTYGTSAPAAGQPSYYTEDNPDAQEEKPDEKLPAHPRPPARQRRIAHQRLQDHLDRSGPRVRDAGARSGSRVYLPREGEMGRGRHHRRKELESACPVGQSRDGQLRPDRSGTAAAGRAPPGDTYTADLEPCSASLALDRSLSVSLAAARRAAL